jgi:hypothetical protein
MSFRLLIALVISVATAAFAPASAERRVAFVMGNGAYKNAIQLPNPPSDAQAMADLLKSMGFEVISGVNLGREAMAEKLSQFAMAANGADVALFFYAGHGFQLGGKNLIVPIDADVKSEFDAKLRTIEIDSVLQESMGDAKVKIVLLDACRDNPFAKQIAAAAPKTRNVVLGTGLAEMRPGQGTLIAFATGPGQVAIDGEGRHSPFTRALLRHLPAQGMEIRHSLTLVRAQVEEETRKQQVPWENTNLSGFFYMTKAAEGTPVSMPQTAAPATPANPQMELALWDAVKQSSNPDEYRAYLERFPTGTFSELARSRVAALSQPKPSGASASGSASVAAEAKTAEANRATEDALGLDAVAWRDIQTRLAALGFGSRGVADGVAGDGTRRAITAWQSARQYPSSGYLNRAQREALQQETPSVQAAAAPAAAPGTTVRSYGAPGGQARAQRPAHSGGSEGRAGEFIGGVIRGYARGGGGLPF